MDYQSREYFSPDQLNQEPITQTVESMGIKSPEMPTLNEKTISEIKAERDEVQVAGFSPKFGSNPFFKCDFTGCYYAVERINSSIYLPGNMRQNLTNYCKSKYGEEAKIGYSWPISIRWCWQKEGANTNVT